MDREALRARTKRPLNRLKNGTTDWFRIQAKAGETPALYIYDEIGYFGDKSPERMCAELQALAGRAMLTQREASLLLAMVRLLSRRITT